MNNLSRKFSLLMFDAFPMDVQLFWLRHNLRGVNRRA